MNLIHRLFFAFVGLLGFVNHCRKGVRSQKSEVRMKEEVSALRLRFYSDF